MAGLCGGGRYSGSGTQAFEDLQPGQDSKGDHVSGDRTSPKLAEDSSDSPPPSFVEHVTVDSGPASAIAAPGASGIPFAAIFLPMMQGPCSTFRRQTIGDVVRWPDYYSLQLNVGTVAGWSGQASVDRYGQFYVGPIGANVGRSLTIVSGSVVGGWISAPWTPTESTMRSYMTGFSGSMGGGFGPGGNDTWTNTNHSIEFGALSPQGGASVHLDFALGGD